MDARGLASQRANPTYYVQEIHTLYSVNNAIAQDFAANPTIISLRLTHLATTLTLEPQWDAKHLK